MSNREDQTQGDRASGGKSSGGQEDRRTIHNHIHAETVYMAEQRNIAGNLASGKSRMETNSERCSLQITSKEITNERANEGENGNESHIDEETSSKCQKSREETNGSEVEKNGELLNSSAAADTHTDGALKRRNASSHDCGDGPSHDKVPKYEPMNAGGTDPVKIYLSAEYAEVLMKKKKFSEAQTALMKAGNTVDADLRFKLLFGECKLCLGLKEDTKKAISDVAEFIRVKSNTTVTEMHDYGTKCIKHKQLGKAMILIAAIPHVSAYETQPDDPNEVVFKIGQIIKSFSDAVRAVPDENRKRRKNSAKKDASSLPLKKRFGCWYEALDVFNPIMEEMLSKLRSVKGANEEKTAKSEAFALNWMSSASYYAQHKEDGLKYSSQGVDILKSKCGGYCHKFQYYADLLHNLGEGTSLCGDKKGGLEYFRKALKHKEEDVKFKLEKEKENSIKATKKCISYWEKA